jgi:alkyl hydroperoxide reductase subunit AhpC
LFREANGFSERTNVLIDEKQNVVFVIVYPVHTVVDIQEVIALIKNLKNPYDTRQAARTYCVLADLAERSFSMNHRVS